MKRKIVIAEYISTGINYIEDVLSRGYEPVLLEGSYIGREEDTEPFRQMRNAINARLSGKVQIIKENPDYHEILEQVRSLNPLLVIAGSEFGVPLAMKLSEDLGLPGNPVSRLKAMTEKDAMHQALKEYGIRSIRGETVRSLEEAERCYRKLETEDVVIKRTRGAGSQGVYLCHGREEALCAVEKELKFSIKNQDEDVALLMQERITGTEYIVNTVSCNGRHRVVSMWIYDKVRLADGTNAYNYAQTVNRLEAGHSRLIRYAFDVLDALGICYGPVHGEFMVDEKGPVLIEVNCRPMGAGLSRKFTEKLFGHHETDVALDAYLEPERFEQERKKPYRPLRKGAIKLFILPEDTRVESAPVLQIARRLKSFYSGSFERVGREPVISRTRNLETTGGALYLMHDDEQAVIDDCRLLHKLEMVYPKILFQGFKEQGKNAGAKAELEDILREMDCRGGTLIFSDRIHDIQGATVVGPEELEGAYDSYEQGILDLSDSETFGDLESTVQQIYKFADKIREGGRLLIPESTYRHLPYGMEGMEILLQVAGLRMEMPYSGMSKILIASR